MRTLDDALSNAFDSYLTRKVCTSCGHRGVGDYVCDVWLCDSCILNNDSDYTRHFNNNGRFRPKLTKRGENVKRARYK